MLRKATRRMLFKVGVTIIVFVAVYMYYAIDQTNLDKTAESHKDKQPLIKDHIARPLEAQPAGQRDFEIPGERFHAGLENGREVAQETRDSQDGEESIQNGELEDIHESKEIVGNQASADNINKVVKPQDKDNVHGTNKDKGHENIIFEEDYKTIKGVDNDIDEADRDIAANNGQKVIKEVGDNIEDSDGNVNADDNARVFHEDRDNQNDNEVTGDEKGDTIEEEEDIARLKRWRDRIHVAVVACGDRMPETLVMFKSAVLFTKTPLVFHIFAEYHLQPQFTAQLNFWPAEYKKKVEYRLYNISFPTDNDVRPEDWKKLFKPCACQRLFIPKLIPDVDSLLYVDTDVLFLSPLEDIWRLFKGFNSTQLAGLAIEHEDKAIGWYNRFARHPYYGEVGVNSGVMLMNLTRLRSSSWIRSLTNYFKEYKLKLTFGDQDLINIYFHFYPEQLYVFSCELNYRPDHCMYMSVCKAAEEVGAVVLHGCRRVWFEDKQPTFKAVYQTFSEHYLGSSLRYDLFESLHRNMKSSNTSNCGQHPQIFTKAIETFLNTTQSKPGS